MCRSRRELSNEYLLAKIGFDAAENEPCKVCPLSAYRLLLAASYNWKSTRANEIEKHERYVTHADGRRCSNMKLYAAVVNTYGKVGQEFVEFCAVIDNSSRGKGRGRNLTNLLSLLGVYANAEQVLLTHAPSMKRAQRGDVKAAIAAKEAQEAAAATAKATKVAQAAAAAQLKGPFQSEERP